MWYAKYFDYWWVCVLQYSFSINNSNICGNLPCNYETLFTRNKEREKYRRKSTCMYVYCIALPLISRYYKFQLWDIYFISIGVLMIILQCFIILVQTTIYISVSRSRNARSKDKYAAVTSAIFICTYFISFVPISVVGIYSKLSSHGLFMESYVIPWVYLLATFNCVADPIVSIMRTPKWREAIFKHVTDTSTSA